MTYRILDTESEMIALTEQWSDLCVRSDSNIYLSPMWIQAWWTHFGKHPSRRIYMVSFWNDSQLVGLAPLFKGTTRIGSHLIETRLRIMGTGGSPNETIGYADDYGISDFLDVLVDRDHEEAVATFFAEFLKTELASIDSILFQQVGDESFILRRLMPAMYKAGLIVGIRHIDTCPYIPLQPHPDIKAYVESVKPNARRRFRQSLRAVESGSLQILDTPESAEDLHTATETLIRLHQTRWNRIGYPGLFHDERFATFFNQVIYDARHQNQLWFKQMADADGVCASRLVLKHNNTYYDYLSGFDDRLASSKSRPGIGLLLTLIQDAITQDIGRIELLRGQEEYKFDFTHHTFQNWALWVEHPSKRAGMTRVARRVVSLIAKMHKVIARESRLLDVQRKTSGLIAMTGGYVRFRYKILKSKLT